METNAVEQWLNTTLKADAQLAAVVGTRVYNTTRPAGSTLPCVIFQLQAAGDDLMGVGPYRVWAPLLYLVNGLAEQSSYEGVLATINNRIDAVLHAQSGTSAAGTIWTCTRERAFQMPEIVDGREYRRSGGLYRIRASKA